MSCTTRPRLVRVISVTAVVMDRYRRFVQSACLSGLFVVVLGGGQNPTSPAPQLTPGQSGPTTMETPLRLIAEAQQSYGRYADYMCQFRKRELIRGQLQPENVIAMRVRTKPFSVYLRWQAPAALAGQEACYVAGRNNGMVRAHSPGWR